MSKCIIKKIKKMKKKIKKYIYIWKKIDKAGEYSVRDNMEGKRATPVTIMFVIPIAGIVLKSNSI
jgi:hypothetical protein